MFHSNLEFVQLKLGLEFQVCGANLGLSNNLHKLWISNFEQTILMIEFSLLQ